MIRRAATIVALVAVSGLLVFGGVHRTQSVLASTDRGSAAVQVRGGGNHEPGSGFGSGTGLGKGHGRGNGPATRAAVPGQATGVGENTSGY